MKLLDDSALDAAAAVVDDTTHIHLCSGAPANHAGIGVVSLAAAAVSPADFSATSDGVSYTVSVAAKSGVPVTVTGTGTHIAGTDGSTLLFLTECSPLPVVNGGAVTIPTFDITFVTDAGTMAAAVYDPQEIAGDAFDRAYHTGTQPISSVSGLSAALAGKADTGDLFDGDYASLSGTPTLGTAAAQNVEAFDPAGAASSAQTAAVTAANNYTDLQIANVEVGGLRGAVVSGDIVIDVPFTPWGLDSNGDPYFDIDGAQPGEEAWLQFDPFTGDPVLIPLNGGA